jgi:SAM-dependent methyltransferase
LSGPEPTVLDIGCGIGRFYNFLQKTGRGCCYIGYDLIPEYVQRASTLYPEIHVIERNILKEPIDGEFDTIVSSQAFNHRFSELDNLEVIQTVIENGFRHCRSSLSIDMLSTYVDYEENHLFYYSPEKVLSIAKAITPRVLLRHDFAPFEFCIQLFRNEAPIVGG